MDGFMSVGEFVDFLRRHGFQAIMVSGYGPNVEVKVLDRNQKLHRLSMGEHVSYSGARDFIAQIGKDE